MKKTGLFLIAVAFIALYLLFWPTPIDPVAWKAPCDKGYTGPFAPNERLSALELISIGECVGPECLTRDGAGAIYAAARDGWIVRLNPDGSNPEKWVNTGGRPLGMAFDSKGFLIIADAYKGLLSISPQKQIAVLADHAGGEPIGYADDLDIALDGRIYFSDASAKFRPGRGLDSAQASMLDLMEHGGNGRLLVFDPAAGKAEILVKGLNFANGIAVARDQKSIFINETGSYRVMRYWISGPKMGALEPVIENLPGFPDNIARGQNGRYWLALVSPRNALADRFSQWPGVRNVFQRLPVFLRPKAKHFGHVIAIDDSGKVVADLQDPKGLHPLNTSVLETESHLYIGSLVSPAAARISKKDAGLYN